MSSDTPPGEKRPPIRDLDEGIDESGAEEAERKREERRNQSALPVAAVEALKLKALGFTIMPLPTDKKGPPPGDWVKAAQNNPAVFLKNPGTHNYAILPPPGCFGWDVDKGVPQLIESVKDTLGVYLPDTLMTMTPNGTHWFLRWPEDLPRPKGPMFGEIVTRWPAGDEGQGYLVGPGSVVVQENGTLGQYAMFGMEDDEPIADLPRAWAHAALAWKPRRVMPSLGPLAEVGGPKYELPESVPSGGRYAAILAYTAHLYNRGLSSNEMWPLVQAELAPKFDEPVALTDLRQRFERAVRDIAERLGEPKSVEGATPTSLRVRDVGVERSTPSQESGEGKLPAQPLFLPMPKSLEALTALGEAVWLVDGWVPANGLVWWAGQPKSMKSLAVLQMLGAFVSGEDWMERGVQETGTRVGMYATKEGTPQTMADRLRDMGDRSPSFNWNRLRIAYPTEMSFDASGLDAMAEYLLGVEQEMSVLPVPLSGILVLDPMRDFMLGGWDENEAKTVGVVKAWCRALLSRYPWVSIILVHHLRKSAGNEGGDGLDMSGSGAAYAAGDATINWWAKRDFADDDEDDGETLVKVEMRLGGYKVEQRGAASFRGRWSFDPLTKLISRERGVRVVATASGSVRAVAGDRTKAALDVLRTAASSGLTASDVATALDMEVKPLRTILYRARDRGECSYVPSTSRWYATGWSPGVAPDGLLPVAAAEEPSSPDDDGEVWVDPLHRV